MDSKESKFKITCNLTGSRCKVTGWDLRAQRQRQHKLSKCYTSSNSQCLWTSKTKVGCHSKLYCRNSNRFCLQDIANKHSCKEVLYPIIQLEHSFPRRYLQRVNGDLEQPIVRLNSILERNSVIKQFNRIPGIQTLLWAQKLPAWLTLKLVDCVPKMFSRREKGCMTMLWSSVWQPIISIKKTSNWRPVSTWLRLNSSEKIESLTT